MKTVIKRELKNYMKNPIFWIGMIAVVIGVYGMLSPYLSIHYFQSDQEIQNLDTVKNPNDMDIENGYAPASLKQRRTLWEEQVKKTFVDEFQMSKEEAGKVIGEMEGFTVEEACRYLEEEYSLFGADDLYEDLKFYKSGAREANQYIASKLEEHPFSYYFAKKFADFAGLYMGFFAIILLAFLFLQDTRKNNYELLHTKPVKPRQYVFGKIASGFLVILLVLAVLNIIFTALCVISAKKSGFLVNPLDLAVATAVYILPNMLMITCVYAVVALLFKNPLPAVPLLFLYMVYSNMGSRNAEGVYGYYGRPLAIMVRFPGRFFDTAPPPLALMNQLFLVAASTMLVTLAVCIWRRRRVY